MGVSGLHSVIKPICGQSHLSEFRGKRAAVDASSWLHKGAISCARDLAYEKPTQRYVDYCLFRVRMMIHFGVAPTLVFDGAPLPMKAAENSRRSVLRKEALETGFDFDREGHPKKADEMFQRAVSITHDMVHRLIQHLRNMDGVEYIVAPYEADAQLAWLSMNEKVHLVITEDSDLLVYGAPRIFYKMDKQGAGELCEAKNLIMLENPSMRNFTPTMFIWVCVLSGCDFYDGIKGLGMRKAHELVRRSRTLDRLLCRIRYDTKYKTPVDFPNAFHRACLVFRHQTVYDVDSGANVHLKPLDDEARAGIPESVFVPTPSGDEDLDFVGRFHENSTAAAVSSGALHPKALTRFSNPPHPPVPAPFSVQRRATGPAVVLKSVSENYPSKQRGGFQVLRAGEPSLSETGSRAVHPRERRPAVPRVSRYFHGSGRPRSRPPLSFSPAVAEAFKDPTNGAVTGNSSTVLPGDGSGQRRSENYSLEKDIPCLQSQIVKGQSVYNANLPHAPGRSGPLKRLSRPDIASGMKRQRTMLDIGAAKPNSNNNRFANLAQRGTKVIGGIRNFSTPNPLKAGSTPLEIGSTPQSPPGRPFFDSDEAGCIDGISIPDVPSSPECGESPVTPAAAPGRVEMVEPRGVGHARPRLSRKGPSVQMMAEVLGGSEKRRPRRSPRKHSRTDHFACFRS